MQFCLYPSLPELIPPPIVHFSRRHVPGGIVIATVIEEFDKVCSHCSQLL